MFIKDAIARTKKDLSISSDDNFFGNRYIYSNLKTIRAELLRQEIEKKGLWSGLTMQTLMNFELQEVDIAETMGVNAGERVLKSMLPFPELMDTKDGKISSGLFLATGERINLVSYTTAINSAGRRFKGVNASAYQRKGYLYIKYYKDDTPVLFVDADGIFEDPEEVDRLNRERECPDECIFYPDLPFYLPKYLEGRFFRMVKEDLSWSLRIPKDRQNNGRDDTTPTSMPAPPQAQQQNQP